MCLSCVFDSSNAISCLAHLHFNLTIGECMSFAVAATNLLFYAGALIHTTFMNAFCYAPPTILCAHIPSGYKNVAEQQHRVYDRISLLHSTFESRKCSHVCELISNTRIGYNVSRHI